MAFKETTAEEKAMIAEGALVVGSWANGKPLQICVALAMSCAARFAARLGINADEFAAYATRTYRDSSKARELQGAMGPDVATVLDGERRILLPHEAL